MNCDILITNIGELVTCASSTPKRGLETRNVGIIRNAAVAIANGSIRAIGSVRDIEREYTSEHTLDAQGNAVVPGFVDPHTHSVYAADRINEFEMRIAGASYIDILAAGGGIHNTVAHTRNASVDELMAQSKKRLDTMLSYGTTTIEIKTGYGLTFESEMKMLQVIEQLDHEHAIDCIPTFLAAHAIPEDYRDKPDLYVDLIIDQMLPEVWNWYKNSHFFKQGLPLFNDVFCEKNAFTLEQAHRILLAGQKLGLRPKIHADEFTNLKAVTMAIAVGAISVDHLDVTPLDERSSLAKSQTVGVILPTVNFNFGSSHFADARSLIDLGAAVALSTDLNPGSAPCVSMQCVMAIACRYQKLLPSEALVASTINAAFAIGMSTHVGSIEVGKFADMLLVDATDYRHLAYQFGTNMIKTVIKRGTVIDSSSK